LIYSYEVNNFVLSFIPPPTPVTDANELNAFMDSTTQTEALLLDNIRLSGPIVSEIPKTLIVDDLNITMTIY
jgi:hypothetical protein